MVALAAVENIRVLAVDPSEEACSKATGVSREHGLRSPKTCLGFGGLGFGIESLGVQGLGV